MRDRRDAQYLRRSRVRRKTRMSDRRTDRFVRRAVGDFGGVGVVAFLRVRRVGWSDGSVGNCERRRVE